MKLYGGFEPIEGFSKNVFCTEPIPSAGNQLCKKECYQIYDSENIVVVWHCPSHGFQKIEHDIKHTNQKGE
mgnify:CR=1 FL=1